MKKVVAVLFMLFCLSANAYAQTPGTFKTLRFDNMALHVFTTTEGPGDISYIFETKDSLLLFELPSIHHLSRQFKEYVAGLNKPVNAILVGYHVGGAAYYPGVPIYASQYAVDFIDSGQEMAVRKSIAASTPDFDMDVIRPTNIVTGDKMIIGGIEFIFVMPTSSPIPGMNVVIPEINAYYQHVLGAGKHPIVRSLAQIDMAIAELEEQRKGGYAIFLDSHTGIEQPQAVTEKIKYLEKIRRIRQSSPTEADFIQAVEQAFPGYDSRFLPVTAANLYK